MIASTTSQPRRRSNVQRMGTPSESCPPRYDPAVAQAGSPIVSHRIHLAGPATGGGVIIHLIITGGWRHDDGPVLGCRHLYGSAHGAVDDSRAGAWSG